MRFKGEEIVRGAKSFIRDLVEQWKVFKYSKTGLSSKFVTEISSYARFIKLQWGDMKPHDLKKKDIELMLNKLDVSNNTRRKYLLINHVNDLWLSINGET